MFLSDLKFKDESLKVKPLVLARLKTDFVLTNLFDLMTLAI